MCVAHVMTAITSKCQLKFDIGSFRRCSCIAPSCLVSIWRKDFHSLCVLKARIKRESRKEGKSHHYSEYSVCACALHQTSLGLLFVQHFNLQFNFCYFHRSLPLITFSIDIHSMVILSNMYTKQRGKKNESKVRECERKMLFAVLKLIECEII